MRPGGRVAEAGTKRPGLDLTPVSPDDLTVVIPTLNEREAMLKVARDDELAGKMGRNERKDIFSWREIAARSIQLYGQILES